MKRRTLFAAALCALLMAGSVFAQVPEKKKITIAVGGKNLFYYLPLTIAERQGYFKEEGLCKGDFKANVN